MSNNTITLTDAEYDFFINEAREAGRREGHLDALQALVTGLGMDINVRALIDSPKAEGEEPDATR